MNQPNEPIFSQFSSVTLTSDRHLSTFNFSVNMRKSSKKKMFLDRNGNRRFKTVDYYPTKELALERFEPSEFTPDAIRHTVYSFYGSNTGKKQVNARVKAIKELVQDQTVKYFLSGTREMYNVDIVVMETSTGEEQIKGIAYAIDPEANTKRVQLKKLYFAFSEVKNTESALDDIQTPYAYVYKGKKHDSVKKSIIAYGKVIERKNIEAVGQLAVDQVNEFLSNQTKEVKHLLAANLGVKVSKDTRKHIESLYDQIARLRSDNRKLKIEKSVWGSSKPMNNEQLDIIDSL